MPTAMHTRPTGHSFPTHNASLSPAQQPNQRRGNPQTFNNYPPHSYGSIVTLDPARLAAVPDAVAVAEIKKVIPRIPTRDGHRDVWAMLEALEKGHDARVTTVANLRRELSMPEQAAVEMAGATTGAEFDALLQSLANAGLVRPEFCLDEKLTVAAPGSAAAIEAGGEGEGVRRVECM